MNKTSLALLLICCLLTGCAKSQLPPGRPDSSSADSPGELSGLYDWF